MSSKLSRQQRSDRAWRTVYGIIVGILLYSVVGFFVFEPDTTPWHLTIPFLVIFGFILSFALIFTFIAWIETWVRYGNWKFKESND